MLSQRRLTWLVEFCGVRAEDLELLASALADAGVGKAVADEFVTAIERYPELHQLIDSTASVAQFKQMLARYVESLFSGNFDDARADALIRIGVIHDRIGLPLATFLGATLQLDEVIVSAIVDRYRDHGDMLTRAILAYRRLATCDVAIITQAFLDARDQTTDDAISQLRP